MSFDGPRIRRTFAEALKESRCELVVAVALLSENRHWAACTSLGSHWTAGPGRMPLFVGEALPASAPR